MGTIAQNLRYSARLLMKQPGFSILAVLVLALGIGANSAMFSLVNGMLLKPLVIRDADRLVGAFSKDTKHPDSYRQFSYQEYTELRERNTVFTGLVGFNLSMVGLREGETTRRVFTDSVSSNYFDVFGVPLYRGRGFTAEEERPGSAIPVTVVSYRYWQKAGADPALVGKTVRVNGKLFTIVGIAPEGFTGTTAMISPELYLPLGVYETVMNDFDSGSKSLADPKAHTLVLVGRLKPGLTQQSAGAQIAITAANLTKTNADDQNQTVILHATARLGVSDRPINDNGVATASVLLLFMSGILLLIASLNVANMMLARATARRKEIAIRLALGAAGKDIKIQLFTEGLLLALLGGVAGLMMSYWSTTIWVKSFTHLLPIDIVLQAAPDPRVLAATMGFCLLSTVLFSLAPAWNLARPNLTGDLKDGEQDTAGGNPRRLWSRRNALVIGQLALSLMLLSAAGLFMRSSISAAHADPGFRVDRSVIIEVDPSLAGYDQARSANVLRTVLGRLRAMPGVESASLAATVPFGMVSLGRSVTSSTDAAKKNEVSCAFNIIATDYFPTMGIPLLRGRAFTEADMAGGTRPRVAILDKGSAQRLWPNGDALGQHIHLSGGGSNTTPVDAEVVGIVGSIQDHMIGGGVGTQVGDGGDRNAFVYVPFGQEFQSDVNLHVRIPSGDPQAQASLIAALMANIRQEIRTVDSNLPVLSLRTLRDHLESSADFWLLRTSSLMFTIFGGVALLMAAVGLYGVRVYMVTRRTREIGIRMAIGASTSDTMRMILAEGLYLTGVGAAIGLVLSLALGKVLSGALYHVSAADPIVLAASPLVLGAISLLACYFPARRASRVDPMVALRHQ